MYLLWLIPFQLWWVRLEWDEFVTWVVWGTVLEMVFTYPIVKISIKYGLKITIYWEKMSDEYVRNKNKRRIASNKASS